MAGIAGLFIAMNGFTKEAVAKARSFRRSRVIILMNGDELRAAIRGDVHFDEQLRRKRHIMNVRGEPFVEVTRI